MNGIRSFFRLTVLAVAIVVPALYAPAENETNAANLRTEAPRYALLVGITNYKTPAGN